MPLQKQDIKTGWCPTDLDAGWDFNASFQVNGANSRKGVLDGLKGDKKRREKTTILSL